MHTVECPKCALRFEPDTTEPPRSKELFCPQCGTYFKDEAKPAPKAPSAGINAAA